MMNQMSIINGGTLCKRFVDLACIFRVVGTNNDLTVLYNSSLFDDLLDDIAPVALFEVNRVTF